MRRSYSLGVAAASTTASPWQALAATSAPTKRRSFCRSAACSAALRSTLPSAVTCVCTRRSRCARPRPAPRVSTSRLTALRRPLTLRTVSGRTPPIATLRSFGSAEVVWYHSLLRPRAFRLRSIGRRNHSSDALVTNSGRLAVIAYWISASKRWTAPNFSRKRPSGAYSCASTTTAGSNSRTSCAMAWASGVRSSRWSRLASMPLAVPRRPAAAPSGFARGRITTSMRSSTDARAPADSSCAITISASAPAGSSPCCWPTSSTTGRGASAVVPVAASATGARLKRSASSGMPVCELPTWSSRTSVWSGRPSPSRTRPCISVRNSALLVKPGWPDSKAGVR